MFKSILLSLLITVPAFGQTMYKCPSPTPGAPPIYQQMPCTPTGGGETLPVKTIPAGTGSGLSDHAKEYMADRDQYWNDKAKADAEESKRQEALRVEKAKAVAAHEQATALQEQAAAQRATAHAIWATGRR